MRVEAENDSYLQKDLEHIAESMKDAEKLRGCRVMVTGATGLIGSYLIRSLMCINRVYGLNMKIYGLIRNEEKARRIYGKLLEREDIGLLCDDITDPGFASSIFQKLESEQAKIDYIIHTAAVTTSKVMVERPVDTILSAVGGTEHMLELARSLNVRSFVYISSMEVYGNLSVYQDGSAERATEEKMGYINPLAVRSDYPESKRMCENLCIAYLSQYGVHVRIARLAQTFGAGTLPWENRVFAQFAKSVIGGTDIVLHTKGLSEGNYCYSSDAVRGILTIMLNGADGTAYNVVNESSHTTIAEMAEMVAQRIAGGRIKVVFDIPEENTYGYAADTKLKLSSDLLRSLGWRPEVSLEEAYRRLIASMQEREIH